MANRTITPAKTAAIVSSFTLLTLYVMAQSGFQLLPGSKSSRIVKDGQFNAALIEQDNSPATQPTTVPLLLPGSKSAAHVVDPNSSILFGDGHVTFAASATQPDTEESRPIVMSGSKVLVPVIPAKSSRPAPRLSSDSTPPATQPAGNMKNQ
jgi:prepilin-type processing-associated H-X9-DG protein